MNSPLSGAAITCRGRNGPARTSQALCSRSAVCDDGDVIPMPLVPCLPGCYCLACLCWSFLAAIYRLNLPLTSHGCSCQAAFYRTASHCCSCQEAFFSFCTITPGCHQPCTAYCSSPQHHSCQHACKSCHESKCIFGAESRAFNREQNAAHVARAKLKTES